MELLLSLQGWDQVSSGPYALAHLLDFGHADMYTEWIVHSTAINVIKALILILYLTLIITLSLFSKFLIGWSDNLTLQPSSPARKRHESLWQPHSLNYSLAGIRLIFTRRTNLIFSTTSSRNKKDKLRNLRFPV